MQIGPEKEQKLFFDIFTYMCCTHKSHAASYQNYFTFIKRGKVTVYPICCAQYIDQFEENFDEPLKKEFYEDDKIEIHGTEIEDPEDLPF